MIRAHLRRSIGGGLGGPLRSLPQESVARAKPALEAERLSLGGAISDRLPACHVRVFHFRAPALPAHRSLPQESVARAKPALEAERLSLGGAISDRLPACHVRVFHFRAPALPAQ